MKRLNLSNPQWRTRNLKKFIFESLQKHKAPQLKEELQFFFYIQGQIENCLQEYYYNKPEKFREFFSDHVLEKFNLSFVDLQKYIENCEFDIHSWGKPWIKEKSSQYSVPGHKTIPMIFTDKIASPLLQTYSAGTGKSDNDVINFIHAVESLASYILKIDFDFSNLKSVLTADIAFPRNYSETYKILNSQGKDNWYTSVSSKNVFAEIYCGTVSNSYSICPLINNELLNIRHIEENTDAPVFIINSIILANQLQEEQIKDYHEKSFCETYDFLKKQVALISNIKGTYDDSRELLEEIVQKFETLLSGGEWGKTNATSLGKRCSQIVPLVAANSFACDIVWSSFYGGINAFKDIDLSPIADRNIHWVIYGDLSYNDVLNKFIKAYSILQNVNLKDLTFIHVPEITDTLNSQKTDITILTPNELIFEAFENQIKPPDNLKDEFATVLAEKYKRKKTNNFLVDPAIRKNALVLLTGYAGHGKSFMGMALSYAIATGGRLFGSWKVKEKIKVLYVLDREVDAVELKKRKKVFEKIYKSKKSSKSVTFHLVSNVNLLEEGKQVEIESKLNDASLTAHPEGEPVKLLVLDHLTKLTQNATNANTWSKIRPWIDHLINDLDLTVLLLHHQNTSGKTYGTSFILNDVNSHIHISKHDIDDTLIMDVTMSKNRHGKTLTKPYKVEFKIDPGHTLSITSDADDCNDGFNWRKSSREEKLKKFVELRETCNIEQIAYQCGVTKHTIAAFARDEELTYGRWQKFLTTSEAQV